MNRFQIAAPLIVALVLAACGQQPIPVPTPVPPTAAPPTETASPIPTATPLPPATATPTPDPLVVAAQQEGQLNVIALPLDWMNYRGLLSAFTEKYGIVVHQLMPDASSAAELDAIQATRTKNRDAAPDVIDVGLPFAVRARQAGLLQPYKVATWDSIPASAKDAQGYWYGDYYGLIVFEYNPLVVAKPPQDWSDLLTGEYQIDRPVDPSNSYRSMMAVYSASVANGGSLDNTLPGLRFFQSLNRSGSLPNLHWTADTVAAGETPIVLNWDYLALADMQAHPHEVDIIVPRSGNVAGLYAQAISAHAPHPNAARLWMEFLYSDEGQLLFLEGYGHPVRFADLMDRGLISPDVAEQLLPPEPFLNALFPSPVQINAADASILGSWRSYVP